MSQPLWYANIAKILAPLGTNFNKHACPYLPNVRGPDISDERLQSGRFQAAPLAGLT
jgi:hypothetical protein